MNYDVNTILNIVEVVGEVKNLLDQKDQKLTFDVGITPSLTRIGIRLIGAWDGLNKRPIYHSLLRWEKDESTGLFTFTAEKCDLLDVYGGENKPLSEIYKSIEENPEEDNHYVIISDELVDDENVDQNEAVEHEPDPEETRNFYNNKKFNNASTLTIQKFVKESLSQPTNDFNNCSVALDNDISINIFKHLTDQDANRETKVYGRVEFKYDSTSDSIGCNATWELEKRIISQPLQVLDGVEKTNLSLKEYGEQEIAEKIITILNKTFDRSKKKIKSKSFKR